MESGWSQAPQRPAKKLVQVHDSLQPGHSAHVNRVLGAAASESVKLAQLHQQVHFKFVVQPNAVDAPTVLIGQLDSASPVHITSLETVQLTRAKVNQAETTYNLVGVNNRPLSVIGVIHLTVSFGAEPHNIEVVVVDGAENQVLFSQQRLGSLRRTLHESSPQGQELTIIGTAYAQVPGQGCWMPAVIQDEPLSHGTGGSNDGGRACLGPDSGSDEGVSATAIQQYVPGAQRNRGRAQGG